MLDLKAINHVGIRIADKQRSTQFYELLGFALEQDAGFEDGHPLVMTHPAGVTLNLLGPASVNDGKNILMDVDEKYCGITHVALTVESLEATKTFLAEHNLEITGSFSFGGMSAVFIRDPDRNVIELDAYDGSDSTDLSGYANHPG